MDKTKEKTETQVVKAVNPQLETVEGRIEFEIQKYELPDEKLKKLKNVYSQLKIKDVDDKKNYIKVKEAIKVMRTLRIGVENKRKDLKDWYLQTGKGIDAEAKRLQSLIAEIEEPLKSKKEEIDAEKQRIKEEEEAKRQKKIDDRVNELIEAGMAFNGHFYAIGDSVSVDINTIAELEEEDFNRLKTRVYEVRDEIEKKNMIEEMHEARKEDLLPFWSFMSDEERSFSFGEMSDDKYKELREALNSKKNEFEAEAERRKQEAIKQAEEAERLEKLRKAFNLEKRSFKYEKEGFERKGDIMVKVVGEKPVTVAFTHLENASEDHFQQSFKENMELVASYEVEAEKERERKQAEAEAEAKEAERKALEDLKAKRLKSLFEYGVSATDEGFLKSISGKEFDVVEDEVKDMNEEIFYSLLNSAKAEIENYNKLIEEEREKDRLSRLSDVEKFENYLNSIKNLEVPILNDRKLSEKLIAVFNNYNNMANEVLKILEKYK